jgi:hypothetical protein
MSRVNGNPRGDRTPAEREMEAFDGLPPPVRSALNGAVRKYAAVHARQLLEGELRGDVGALLAVIRRQDAAAERIAR